MATTAKIQNLRMYVVVLSFSLRHRALDHQFLSSDCLSLRLADTPCNLKPVNLNRPTPFESL
ncbi:hypothetical protein GBA52_019010 [Prunus armeniaca]|nr:hypothetical protein GBA52_019010 [Prunus armeniaca]